MIYSFLRRGVFTLLILLAAGSVCPAGEPTELIRKATDGVIAILNDPSLKGPDKTEEKVRKIREAVDKRFAWEEISKRTLARYWKERTPAERAEFIKLFGKLLERTYLDKVKEGYSGEKVLYVDEKVEGRYGRVRVMIVTKQNTEIPVEYRMLKKGDNWLIYDISIEGVSLVNNYRKQFSHILSRSSYSELLERLRAKVEGTETID